MTCVFCEIVAGRAPATIVAEDDDAIAIVPLNPVTDGHVIVLPREHVADAADDPSTSGDVMVLAANLAALHQSANIITSIGADATQTVFHLHLHVVPRRPGDGLALPWTGQKRDPAAGAPVEACREAARRLRQASDALATLSNPRLSRELAGLAGDMESPYLPSGLPLVAAALLGMREGGGW